MTYLFWAYAVVWIGLFVYLRIIMRRTEALRREVEALERQAGAAAARSAESTTAVPAARVRRA